MKQSKLRRRRVVRYAVLYFTLLIVFVGLIAGPVVVGDYDLFPKSLYNDLTGTGLFKLAQPTGLLNDNTLNTTETGIKAPDYSGIWTGTGTEGIEARDTGRVRLF